MKGKFQPGINLEFLELKTDENSTDRLINYLWQYGEPIRAEFESIHSG
jgi:hypothetical protein